MAAAAFSSGAGSVQESSSIRLNCKVDRELPALEALHKRTGWTPGEASVRPTPQARLEKNRFLEAIEKSYVALSDYILDIVFEMTVLKKEKYYVERVALPKKKIFAKNQFP